MITVSIAILALMAWIVMIVFVLVPKRLTLTELLFMYFVAVILTITLFTALDINLHWVPITRRAEGSFAMYICRFIFIPLLVLLGAAILLSRLHAKWRGALTVIIVLALTGADRVYLQLNLLKFENWNSGYSFLMYGAFVILIWRIARWYIGLDKEVSSQS
jgi:hypothetical protein